MRSHGSPLTKIFASYDNYIRAIAPAAVTVGRANTAGSIDNQANSATINATPNNEASSLVRRDGSGNFVFNDGYLASRGAFLSALFDSKQPIGNYHPLENQRLSTSNNVGFSSVLAGTGSFGFHLSSTVINLGQQASNGQSADLGARFSIVNTANPITYFGQQEPRKIDMGEDFRGAYIRMFSSVNNFLDYKGDSFISHNANTGKTFIPGLAAGQMANVEVTQSGTNTVVKIPHGLTNINAGSIFIVQPHDSFTATNFKNYVTWDEIYVYAYYTTTTGGTYQYSISYQK